MEGPHVDRVLLDPARGAEELLTLHLAASEPEPELARERQQLGDRGVARLAVGPGRPATEEHVEPVPGGDDREAPLVRRAPVKEPRKDRALPLVAGELAPLRRRKIEHQRLHAADRPRSAGGGSLRSTSPRRR